MISISDKSKQVAPSSTLALTAKINAMVADGLDVVKFGAGEPDFDTPKHIKNQAIKAINDGFTKYTQVDGIPELKKSIMTKFETDNYLKYDLDQITVGVGGKHVIYNLFMSTLNKNDEVIIKRVLDLGADGIIVPVSYTHLTLPTICSV